MQIEEHLHRNELEGSRGRRLDRQEFTRLPLTIKERIYPLTMVQRNVEDRLTGSHYSVSRFELMRRGDTLYWTAQKTPVGLVNRMALEDVAGVGRARASREKERADN